MVAIDVVTKWWARNHLATADRHVLGPLWLRLSANQGFSFSLAHSWPIVASLGELVALVAVLVAVRFVATVPAAVGFGLILGGGVANLGDRIGSSTHAVTDFIAVGSFPIFNCADAAITIGVVVLGALTLSGKTLWVKP
jgi:signal peptidase II